MLATNFPQPDELPPSACARLQTCLVVPCLDLVSQMPLGCRPILPSGIHIRASSTPSS